MFASTTMADVAERHGANSRPATLLPEGRTGAAVVGKNGRPIGALGQKIPAAPAAGEPQSEDCANPIRHASRPRNRLSRLTYAIARRNYLNMPVAYWAISMVRDVFMILIMNAAELSAPPWHSLNHYPRSCFGMLTGHGRDLVRWREWHYPISAPIATPCSLFRGAVLAAVMNRCGPPVDPACKPGSVEIARRRILSRGWRSAPTAKRRAHHLSVFRASNGDARTDPAALGTIVFPIFSTSPIYRPMDMESSSARRRSSVPPNR